MREIVEKLIEKVEYFEVNTEEWQELKNDLLKELEVKDTPDNQYLWVCIRELASFMERYVG